MAYCKRCRADIKWIRLTSGKWNPVNPAKRMIRRDSGSETLVTEDGKLIHGTFASYEDGANGVGYVSHFETCPSAKKIANTG